MITMGKSISHFMGYILVKDQIEVFKAMLINEAPQPETKPGSLKHYENMSMQYQRVF